MLYKIKFKDGYIVRTKNLRFWLFLVVYIRYHNASSKFHIWELGLPENKHLRIEWPISVTSVEI